MLDLLRSTLNRVRWLSAFVLLVLVPTTHAKNAATLLDRLHAADAGSALDVVDVKPWHLKMTVQLFDNKGKPIDQGTVEEWWNSPGTDRREYKTGTYNVTEVRAGGKLYRTKGAGLPPYSLELLREQVVHPMPKTSEVDQSTPEARKAPFGKVSLDCIMLSQPVGQIGFLPLGLFPTYCFDQGNDVLRASIEFGQQTVLRNAVGTFQGRSVATKVSVMSGETQVASGEIVTLSGATLPDSEFAIPDDAIEQSLVPVRVSSGVAAGNILSKPDAIYPKSARQNHIEGLVILHAIIGTDGHIHSLRLMSAPNPDLAISAIAAVSKWTYKPYMLQGIPVDVDTTITVKYTISPD